MTDADTDADADADTDADADADSDADDAVITTLILDYSTLFVVIMVFTLFSSCFTLFFWTLLLFLPALHTFLSCVNPVWHYTGASSLWKP